MPKTVIGRKIREEMGLISTNPLDKINPDRTEFLGIQKDKDGKYILVRLTVNDNKIVAVEIDPPKGKAFVYSRFKTEAGRHILK